MRLFVALDLPDDVRRELFAICRGVSGARWTRPAQLHFTLRFIGELAPEAVSALKEALSKLSGRRFEGRIQGTGRYPRRGPTRILWAGFSPEQPLDELQKAVEAAVRSAGVAAEEKPFSPHVTLARLKDADRAGVDAFLERSKNFATAEFPLDSFVLYSSTLTPAGPIYKKEAAYPLIRSSR